MDNGSVSKIAVLGDQSLLSGFKLAGVKELYHAPTYEEGEALLSKLLSEQSLGIIIVSEELLEKIDHRLKKKVEATAKPVVISIPGKSGPMEQTESLAMLIKRALGFDIMKGNKK